MERHGFTLLVLWMLYSLRTAPPAPYIHFGLGADGPYPEAPAARDYTYWGDVDRVGTYLGKAPEKHNRYANTAFILNPSLAKRRDVTPEMIWTNRRICEHYVRRFAHVAREEMRKYGIPASITLAQALLESDAGGSRLTKKTANHFGIKCFSRTCKRGHCTNFEDDTHKDFFRIYKNAWESFRAHSLLLQGKRYKHLQAFGKDYRRWAEGLQKAGYATDKHYAKKLIRLIESLHLDEFDRE